MYKLSLNQKWWTKTLWNTRSRSYDLHEIYCINAWFSEHFVMMPEEPQCFSYVHESVYLRWAYWVLSKNQMLRILQVSENFKMKRLCCRRKYLPAGSSLLFLKLSLVCCVPGYTDTQDTLPPADLQCKYHRFPKHVVRESKAGFEVLN